MRPTAGRIVLYSLTQSDAREINRRRCAQPHEPGWPQGAQAHVGNPLDAGDVCPMMIVNVWSDSVVNGQVFLDGNDVFWATSVEFNDIPGMHGTWRWPEIQS